MLPIALAAAALAADPPATGITGGYATTWVAAEGPPTLTVQWVPGYRYDAEVQVHVGDRTVAMLPYPDDLSSPTVIEVTQVEPGFYPVHVQWSQDVRADLRFWAALGPGTDIRLVQPSGPQLAEAPPGLRCGMVVGEPRGVWELCENGTPLQPGRGFSLATCSKPPFSADRVYVKQKRGGDDVDGFHFVPSMPGLYVFSTNGSRIRAEWLPDYGGVEPKSCAEVAVPARDRAAP